MDRAKPRKNRKTRQKPRGYSVFASVNGLFSQSYRHLDTFEANTEKEARTRFDDLKKETTLPWRSIFLVRNVLLVGRGEPCI